MTDFLYQARAEVKVVWIDGVYHVRESVNGALASTSLILGTRRDAMIEGLRARAQHAAIAWYHGTDYEGPEDGEPLWLLQETAGELFDVNRDWRRAARKAIDWWNSDGGLAMRRRFYFDPTLDTGV